jgi:type II secretory pathway pseudopilin PulG
MNNKTEGFVLIEAMIALMVSAVGLLGIALVSSSYLSESVQTKSESEALAIAQNELEELHKLAGSYSLVSIASGSVSWPVNTSVAGKSENYFVSSAYKSIDNDILDAAVLVSWSSGSVTLNTNVARDIYDSRLEGGNNNNGTISNPYNINLPTGGAEYGKDAPAGVLPNIVTLTGDQLSVVSVVEGSSGGIELIYTDSSAAEGEQSEYVLLTYSGSAFAEVRGVVYVDYSSTQIPHASYSDLIVRASDTGVCPRSDSFEVGDGSGDWFVEYRCFFGAGWYGNIDVLYDAENPESYRDLCVGDPSVTDDGTDLSSHPNWILPTDNKREYRGYALAVNESGYEVDGSGNLMLVAAGLTEGAVYGYGEPALGQNLVVGDGSHDFVLVNRREITAGGSSGELDEQDSSCLAVMSPIAVSTYDGHFPGTTGTASGAFSNFLGNNGDFICLQVNGVFSCPANIPDSLGVVTSAATYTISGTISQASSSTLVSTATSQFPTGVINNCTRDGDSNLSCTSEPICTNTSSSYSCSVIVASGASWSGAIAHSVSDANFSICDPIGGSEVLSGVTSSTTGGEVIVVEGSCNIDYTGTYDLILTNGVGNKVSIKSATVSYNGSATCSNIPKDNDYNNVADDAVFKTLSGSCNVSSGDLLLSDTITVGSLTADVTAITPASGGSSGSISATLQPK